MKITQTDHGKKGSFNVELDGAVEGELVYIWAGTHKIIIEHTEVSEKMKGMNAGKQLVQKAVEFAREKGIKIIPLCPFANSVFHKTPEYRDVLD